MRKCTLSAAHADYKFDGGRVRIERDGQPLTNLSLDLASLLVLVGAYAEVTAERAGTRGTNMFVVAASELCRWLLDLIATFRRRHGQGVPLPYKLFWIPGGETLRFGKLLVRKDGSTPGFNLDDRLTIWHADDAVLDVDEKHFAKLLNSAAIELWAPLWEALRRNPEPPPRVQRYPGFDWLIRLFSSRGPGLWLAWLVFRPVVWARSIFYRTALTSGAQAFRDMVGRRAFDGVRQDALLLAGDIDERLGRLRAEEERIAGARRKLGEDEQALVQQRGAFDREKEQHPAALRQLRDANAEALRAANAARLAAEEREQATARRLEQLEERYRELLGERNTFAASLDIPARND